MDECFEATHQFSPAPSSDANAKLVCPSIGKLGENQACGLRKQTG
jgi:hypothetical protein